MTELALAECEREDDDEDDDDEEGVSGIMERAPALALMVETDNGRFKELRGGATGGILAIDPRLPGAPGPDGDPGGPAMLPESLEGGTGPENRGDDCGDDEDDEDPEEAGLTSK